MLAGFLVASTTLAVNHAVDLDLGGHGGDPWGLAALPVLTTAALVVRLGQLGWVVGEVTTAASPALAGSYARRRCWSPPTAGTVDRWAPR